jgi:cytochrome c553
MTVSPQSLSLAVGATATLTVTNPSGTLGLRNSDAGKVAATLKGNVVTVKGKAAGNATLTIRDSKSSRSVPVQVTGGGGGAVVIGNTAGRLLASNCFQCHGTYGSGGFEKLLGETEAEILEELREYQADPDFTTDIMAAHLQGYTDAQLQAIAKYLANP